MYYHFINKNVNWKKIGLAVAIELQILHCLLIVQCKQKYYKTDWFDHPWGKIDEEHKKLIIVCPWACVDKMVLSLTKYSV